MLAAFAFHSGLAVSLTFFYLNFGWLDGFFSGFLGKKFANCREMPICRMSLIRFVGFFMWIFRISGKIWRNKKQWCQVWRNQFFRVIDLKMIFYIRTWLSLHTYRTHVRIGTYIRTYTYFFPSHKCNEKNLFSASHFNFVFLFSFWY